MAGISKLIGMGLTSIFGGGDGDKPAGPGGLLDAAGNPGKMSGLSLLDGTSSSTADKPAYSPLKNMQGIGF